MSTSSYIGVCPQHDILFSSLTVYQHLLFYTRLKGIVPRSSEDQYVRSIACSVSLDGNCYNRYIHTLSGGMRRRVSIAISLIGNPGIWLVDEPASSLSPDTAREVWSIIQRERNKGRAIILTTHNLLEAQTLATQVAIMAQGSLQYIGTTDELKHILHDGWKLTAQLQQPTITQQEAFVEWIRQIVGHHINIDIESSWITTANISYRHLRIQLHPF